MHWNSECILLPKNVWGSQEKACHLHVQFVCEHIRNIRELSDPFRFHESNCQPQDYSKFNTLKPQSIDRVGLDPIMKTCGSVVRFRPVTTTTLFCAPATYKPVLRGQSAAPNYPRSSPMSSAGRNCRKSSRSYACLWKKHQFTAPILMLQT